MGNILSNIALAPVNSLFLHGNFRNTDDEFPDRASCPTAYYKDLTHPCGQSIRAPLYICSRAPSMYESSPGKYNNMKARLDEDETRQERSITVLLRDIGLEHESSVLRCKVCQVLGLSNELGLVFVYSLQEIPVPSLSQLSTANKNSLQQGEPEEGQCSICYDERRDGLVRTACGHVFHNRCLDCWTVIRRTCPYCRTALGV